MPPTESKSPPPPADQAGWRIPEAIAGWVIPGLGHVLLGRRARGIVLAVTIGGVWLAGLLMGGISTFDRRENTAWFGFCQVWVGPAVVVDQIHQRMKGFRAPRPPEAGEPAPNYEPAYGRMQEQALLYTSLAGLMNLLALFDIAYCDPRQFPENRRASRDDGADDPASKEASSPGQSKPAATGGVA